jgi:hypothetical protein
MTDAVAASLIPQIIFEHEAITSVVGKAYQTALQHGIKCGEYLTLAKETVEKAQPKVSWQTWLIKNLPFPQTTASLYMRLYKNREFLAGISSNALLGAPGGWADFSIRSANELIKKKEASERTPQQQADMKARTEAAKATKATNTAAKAGVAAPDDGDGSIDLEDLLPNSAPDEVFKVLADNWEEEDLTKLSNLLAAHLAKLKVPPPPKAPEDPIRRLPPTNDPRPPSRP